jgi:hypothetical protein
VFIKDFDQIKRHQTIKTIKKRIHLILYS